MIYPGAVWVGGAAAGYARGRNAMRACVLHYTVGVDSTGIGTQGYFNFLVAKDGTVEQFAEADALTFHAGEANPTGPGIEFERLSDAEPLTAEQLAAGGALISWLVGLGIPDTFHDGARIPPAQMSGFVTHRSTQQSQPHSDYVTADDWAAMRSGSTPTIPQEDAVRLIQVQETQEWVLVTANGAERNISPDRVWAYASGGIPTGTMPAAYVDAFVNSVRALVPAGGGGGAACKFQPAPTTFRAV